MKRLVGVLSLAAVGLAALEECGLKALEGSSLSEFEALARATLSEKHATNLVGVVREPCSAVKQGMVTMGFKMKNTAGPLAELTRRVLETVEGAVVAEVWGLIPAEPRTWMLKAFINSLPCRVSPGATKCDEEATNAILAKFEEARFAYTQRRLADLGLDPFPAEEPDEAKSSQSEDGVRRAMERYVKRLGIDGEASAWVLSEFKAPEDASAGLVEPPWFSGIASRCRVSAHAQVPDVRDSDETADLADLAAATRVAVWAWHYKDCHRTLVLAAFRDKDKPPEEPASAADEL